jgi:uncharacterized lipoprotein YajG
MKTITLSLACLAVSIIAGCATGSQQVAYSEPCKVAPLPDASIDSYGGRSTKPVDKLDQERALAQLQATPFYRQQLRQRGYGNNTLADAVRECY